MRLVVDANIVFAALIAPGETIRVLLWGGHELYAPQLLRTELEEHLPEIRERTRLPSEDVDRFIETIFRRITVVEKSSYRPLMARARRLCPNPADAAYFALALRLGVGLWSNEKRLKEQREVAVFATHELCRAS